MVDLLPGANVENALQLVGGALHDAQNIAGSGHVAIDLLNAYRSMANQQARLLTSVLTPDSVRELLLTPGYERLLLLDPVAYGLNGLSTLVELELATAIAALSEAKTTLERRQQRWRDWRRGPAGQPLSVVVLDTNVLLRHGERLTDIDWSSPLGLFPDEPIALGIPLVVVKELDDLKTTTQKMILDGIEVQTKSRVRIVHKLLDEWFVGPHTDVVLHRRTSEEPDRVELAAKLMVDDLRHVRLPTADAEIIDRALALTPFTQSVALATNDRAMRIQARFEGLNAFDPVLLHGGEPPERQ